MFICLGARLCLISCVAADEGNGTPLQYSCLENPMDRGAWWAAVHGVAKSRTWLGDFTFTFHFHALENEMATHSSVLAWRIPGTLEPGGLPSMGLRRIGHDWSDLAEAVAATIWSMLLFNWATIYQFNSSTSDCSFMYNSETLSENNTSGPPTW